MSFEAMKTAAAHRVTPIKAAGLELFAKTPNALQWATIKQLLIRSQRDSDTDAGAECLMEAEARLLELLCDAEGLTTLTDEQIAELQSQNGAVVSQISDAITESLGLGNDDAGDAGKNS